MRSVAEELKALSRAEAQRMTTDERLALALALGERDLEIFCAAQGLARDQAVKLVERRRQLSRAVPSAAMLETIG